MADVSELYRAIALEKNRLDHEHPEGFVCVISVRNFSKNSTPGTVSEVPNAIAARHLVDGTARVATNEEREAHIQRGILFAAKCAAADGRRSPALGQTLVIMPGQGSK